MNEPIEKFRGIRLSATFLTAFEREDYETCSKIQRIVKERLDNNTLDLWCVSEGFRCFISGEIDHTGCNGLYDEVIARHPELFTFEAAPEWAKQRIMAGNRPNKF